MEVLGQAKRGAAWYLGFGVVQLLMLPVFFWSLFPSPNQSAPLQGQVQSDITFKARNAAEATPALMSIKCRC